MRVFGDDASGNCQKIKLVADHLGIPYVWEPVNVLEGGSRTPDYLSRFPAGQVPGVQFDDGRRLAQSNAIIRYLARGTRLVREDPFRSAKVDEWLFWEQYTHEPSIAVCRFEMRYLRKPAGARDPARVAKGEAALDLMERHLAETGWFVDDRISIADIALLAYTRLAHEGGFDLGPRPSVRSWITRCEAALSAPYRRTRAETDALDEAPDLTDEMFESADVMNGAVLVQRGYSLGRTERLVLPIAMVERFRAGGPGWQIRIEAALEEWMAEHPDRL